MSPFRQRIDYVQTILGQGEVEKASLLISALLNDYPGSAQALYLQGEILRKQNKNGDAACYYMQALEQSKTPDEDGMTIRPAVIWNALGLAHKAENRKQVAESCFIQAFKGGGNKQQIFGNIAGMYTESGQPDRVIRIADKILAAKPDEPVCRFAKGLALLEKGRWEEGWPLWNAKYRMERELEAKNPVRNYWPDGRTPLWDGTPGKTVVIHGEQGIGDEILFASCFPDAIRDCKHVIIHCTPRLYKLFADSFPEATVYGGHEHNCPEWVKDHEIDAVIPMGMLPGLYRKQDSDFPSHLGYLKPDPDWQDHYRARLAMLGPRPKIGLAWIGGVKTTNQLTRSMPLANLEPIYNLDADFISLNYLGFSGPEARGEGVIHWKDVVEADKKQEYAQTAALISCLDLVMSVTTTTVDACGALGVPCWVLVPPGPPWRYGFNQGVTLPWYPSVTLYRQAGDEGWLPVIDRIVRDLDAWLAERQAKEAA